MSALDSFRNPTPESIEPLLAAGVPSFYGQTDVEGNVGFFNNIDANTIKVEANLILPFGNQQLIGTPTIATDGAYHYVPGVQANPAISNFPSDANGNLLASLPGAYLYDVSIRITVTSPSANWIVNVTAFTNGSNQNASTFAFPSTLLIANINYTVNFYLYYPADFIGAGGTAPVGFQVSVSGAATATINYVDGQLNYVGNYSNNSKVRPSEVSHVVIDGMVVPTIMDTPQ